MTILRHPRTRQFPTVYRLPDQDLHTSTHPNPIQPTRDMSSPVGVSSRYVVYQLRFDQMRILFRPVAFAAVSAKTMSLVAV